MKQIKLFSQIFASTLFLLFVFGAMIRIPEVRMGVEAQTVSTCTDNEDNDGDGRADWDGVPEKNLPPDPSCINEQSVEKADDVKSTLIPCTDKCDLGSVFALINNVIDFLIKVILFPIAILMFVYAGYTYIVHSDNPGKRVKAKSLIKHLILGMVLILTAWVIVKSLLVVVGYNDRLLFFD